MEPQNKTASDVESKIMIERRSVDPDLVFQAMEATGILAGGVGTLALGVSKFKDAFGTSDEAAPEQTPSKPTPRRTTSRESGERRC
jgi:hypothetical protein